MLGPLGWPAVTASGAGSLIDMSHVETFNGHTFINFSSTIKATGGATIDLSACTQMPGGILQVTADGTDSLVDLSSLEVFKRTTGGTAYIKATNHGTIPLSDGVVAVTNAGISIGGGGLISAGTIQVLGASVLSGSGILQATVLNDNQVQVGGAPGNLIVDGDYTQTDSATLAIEVGGTEPITQFDRLTVTGDTSLAGTLALSQLNGFEPELEQTFRIVDSTSVAGRFNDVTGTALPNDLGYVPFYGPGDVTLHVVLRSGPAVVNVTPSGIVTARPTAIDVQFDLPIEPTSFGPDDVVLTHGSDQLSVGQPTNMGGNLWRVPLPALADTGEYTLTIGPEITDQAGNQMDQDKDKNNGEPEDVFTTTLDIQMPNLVTDSVVPDDGVALFGDSIGVSWQVTNKGNTAATGIWRDAVWLSIDNILSPKTDVLLGKIMQTNMAVPAGTPYAGSASVQLPLRHDLVAGDYFLLNQVNAGEQLNELTVTDNVQATTTPVALAFPELPDLTLSDFAIAPVDPLSGDQVTATWMLHNDGEAAVTIPFDETIRLHNDTLNQDLGAVSVSYDPSVVGNLAPTGQSERTATLTLPDGTMGAGQISFTLDTDAADVVFERNASGDAEQNNAATATINSSAALYPDLITSAVIAPSEVIGDPAQITVGWTVTNSGDGSGRVASWSDGVVISGNDVYGDGDDRVVQRFAHQGPLAVGETYTRSETFRLPPALSGRFHLFVVATWTVVNDGPGVVDGSWVDKVYLQQANDPDAPTVPLGNFWYTGALDVGQDYTRHEAIRTANHVSGEFHVVVTTNFDQRVFEGAGSANNTRLSAATTTLTVKPRPDLQVANITAPDEVDAGATLAVGFEVTNQSTVATDVPRWVDRVYLSLDGTLTRDDILIEELSNQSALGPGESYAGTTQSAIVPKRFRGDVYILVVPDADEQMDEWPQEDNNVTAKQIYVNPLPLPDLVVHDVIAPTQAVQGASIQIGFTVTNRGPGATDVDQWTDTIWLTQDRNRPHPGLGDVLLKTLTHTGSLQPDTGYDVENITVTLPESLAAGTYYIMPWTDPYDVVLEDTLANNVNLDDPNQIDNNNYKARAVDVLGALPDLVVTDATADASAIGGEVFHLEWTVLNESNGPARPGGWTDRVYLSSHADPHASGATTMILGDVQHAEALEPGSSYTADLAVTLAPSAQGNFVIVATDAVGGEDDVFYVLDELNESNNSRAVTSAVISAPADLVVTDIQLPANSASGEPIEIRYTVTNVGTYPVWQGTDYWKDFLWITADSTFVRDRASYLGTAVHVADAPLAPGASYDVVFQTTLPAGLDGEYQIYIHLDAHNDITPLFFPMQARILRDHWWPAHSGDNSQWLSEFARWAYEDPANNIASAPMMVTYREPDLQVAELTVPDNVHSGEQIVVTYTVESHRHYRTEFWNGRRADTHQLDR